MLNANLYRIFSLGLFAAMNVFIRFETIRLVKMKLHCVKRKNAIKKFYPSDIRFYFLATDDAVVDAYTVRCVDDVDDDVNCISFKIPTFFCMPKNNK